MHKLPVVLLFVASAASAQVQGDQAASWQPTAPYVTVGQDEPGYRNWYMAAPWHATYIRSFNDYLTTYDVAGTVPTWQLLRTASDWQKCGAQPFEVPPTETWPNIVQTLRYIRDEVLPTVGPVEPVSGYRNPELNRCAGGAGESAHRYFQAVDLVPLNPVTREVLIHELCAVHAKSGERYGVGLGFYAFLRFHIDSRKFRKWGMGDGPEAAACLGEPAAIAGAPDAPPLQPAPQSTVIQPPKS